MTSRQAGVNVTGSPRPMDPANSQSLLYNSYLPLTQFLVHSLVDAISLTSLVTEMAVDLRFMAFSPYLATTHMHRQA